LTQTPLQRLAERKSQNENSDPPQRRRIWFYNFQRLAD
jgi:hypothetical protein